MKTGARCITGALRTGLGRLTEGGLLTSFEYRAIGARGDNGAFRAIFEEGINGALLKFAYDGVRRTFFTEGARGTDGAGRKPQTTDVKKTDNQKKTIPRLANAGNKFFNWVFRCELIQQESSWLKIPKNRSMFTIFNHPHFSNINFGGLGRGI